MSTHPDSDSPDKDQVEQPSDGPAREPGSGGDQGATSQDQPEPEGSAASGGGDGSRAAVPNVPPEPPADSNERADDRVEVVGPGEARDRA